MTRFEPWTLTDFVRESNRIEGIACDPTEEEIGATWDFLDLDRITIIDLVRLVSVYAPGHVLRDRAGLDVRVGNYIAPRGGPQIAADLTVLLSAVSDRALQPWHAHVAYERLHPFTDGNGRSGRALWLWMHGGEAPIGFLHRFYYETLANDPSRLPSDLGDPSGGATTATARPRLLALPDGGNHGRGR